MVSFCRVSRRDEARVEQRPHSRVGAAAVLGLVFGMRPCRLGLLTACAFCCSQCPHSHTHFCFLCLFLEPGGEAERN